MNRRKGGYERHFLNYWILRSICFFTIIYISYIRTEDKVKSHTHTHTTTHIHTYTHTHTLPHTFTHTHTHIHTHTQLHTHTYTHTHTHTYTHHNTHTHAYTHTHTYTQPHTHNKTKEQSAKILLRNGQYTICTISVICKYEKSALVYHKKSY